MEDGHDTQMSSTLFLLIHWLLPDLDEGRDGSHHEHGFCPGLLLILRITIGSSLKVLDKGLASSSDIEFSL